MARDKLDSLSVKLATKSLYKPICFIINLSIETNTFCVKWKLAKVVPLHKGKGKSWLSPSSFRPISLLPVCKKITEMAIKEQIAQFMSDTKQWGMYNHGYKTLHGTTTTLLNLCDAIYETCDENKISTAITTDQSAAFDCVSHNILIQKLKLYNFWDSALEWIKSYLTFRTQFVSIGSKESVMMQLPQGVPQGSGLGQIIHTIYINKMGEIPNHTGTCQNPSHETGEMLFNTECKDCGMLFGYADDMTYLSTTKTREKSPNTTPLWPSGKLGGSKLQNTSPKR